MPQNPDFVSDLPWDESDQSVSDEEIEEINQGIN